MLKVDIEKRLGSFQLKTAFQAEDGVLALLGASGSGKSMTLKCIAGIEKPDRGRIELDGRVLFDAEKRVNLPPQKRHVGYLFQQYALFPNMTARQNIAAGLRSKENGTQILDQIMESMDLNGLGDKRPAQLSGGQQQRVALARILVNRPELLLLDEPFSALDSHLRFRLEQQVREVIRRFGKPVVLVSHDRDEVFRLCDRVAVIGNGQVEVCGDKAEVFADPATKTAAILTGCKNISRLVPLGDRRARAVDWGMDLNLPVTEGAEYVGIRMHDIRPGEGENTFLCRVCGEVENPFSVTVLLVPVDTGQAAPIGWELDKESWRALRGETVTVHLPTQSILLLRGS